MQLIPWIYLGEFVRRYCYWDTSVMSAVLSINLPSAEGKGMQYNALQCSNTVVCCFHCALENKRTEMASWAYCAVGENNEPALPLGEYRTEDKQQQYQVYSLHSRVLSGLDIHGNLHSWSTIDPRWSMKISIQWLRVLPEVRNHRTGPAALWGLDGFSSVPVSATEWSSVPISSLRQVLFDFFFLELYQQVLVLFLCSFCKRYLPYQKGYRQTVSQKKPHHTTKAESEVQVSRKSFIP